MTTVVLSNDNRVTVTQSGVSINFNLADLCHDDREAIKVIGMKFL